MDLKDISAAIADTTATVTAALAANKLKAAETDGRLMEIEQRLVRRGSDGSYARPSFDALAQKLHEAPALQSLLSGHSRTAHIPVAASELLVDRKNTIIDGGTGLSPVMRVLGIVANPIRRPWLRDRLTTLPATSGVVEYVRETGFTNRAGIQRDNASPEMFEGATKPESDMGFEARQAKVPTIAHFVKASLQALSDQPNLQEFIDGRLRDGLELALEDQILNGSGSEFPGLISAGNYTAYAGSGGSPDTDTLVDVVRKAVTQLELQGFAADTVILNPSDWGDAETLKDSQGRYIIGRPTGAPNTGLWTRGVLSTPSIEQGKFIVASLAAAAVLWMRQTAQIDIALQNNDDFTKNLATIRAELRAVVTVFRPLGIVYGDLP